MKEAVQVKWAGNMAFEADVDNYRIMLDAKPEQGGLDKGPRPKPLMMVALAGCTSMDVVSILKKMQIELDYFNTIVEGDLTEEHPKHYTAMHIIYEFRGKDLPYNRLQRAIELSQDKYCGVSAVYKKILSLTYEIKIL